MFGHAYCQSVNFDVRHVSWGHCIWVFGGRCKPRPGDHETSQAQDSRPRVDEDAVLSRNDSTGSVVLAASSSARASLFPRYGPSIGPRLALASSCERIRDAIPFLPTESFRPAGGLRLTLGVDRDLLFSSCDPVTPLPSLLGTDDFSGARGRCGWKTGIGIQCESKVESSQPRPASGLPGH